jgi:hypothetical protein
MFIFEQFWFDPFTGRDTRPCVGVDGFWSIGVQGAQSWYSTPLRGWRK